MAWITLGRSEAANTWPTPPELNGTSEMGCVPSATHLRSRSSGAVGGAVLFGGTVADEAHSSVHDMSWPSPKAQSKYSRASVV